MIEIISIVLSAIGVMLLLYSLSFFILKLSVQGNSESTGAESYNKGSEATFDRSLITLGVSLAVILLGRMVLSLSVNVGDFFYYCLFVNIVGILFILSVSFYHSFFRISELLSAFLVICAALIVLAVDYVFL